jgi:transaldolase
VNTMPEKTLDAVVNHGQVTGDTVRGRYDEAAALLDRLAGLGIGYGEVTELLETEGVDKFEKSWGELLATISDELARAAIADSAEEAGQ